VPSVFTDVTDPATRVTTTFTDANGDVVTKTTIDGHFTSVTNGVTGPFHTTIFRIAHAATGRATRPASTSAPPASTRWGIPARSRTT
jgi:hypothetical protein